MIADLRNNIFDAEETDFVIGNKIVEFYPSPSDGGAESAEHAQAWGFCIWRVPIMRRAAPLSNEGRFGLHVEVLGHQLNNNQMSQFETKL
jgi:hypothetical protein